MIRRFRPRLLVTSPYLHSARPAIAYRSLASTVHYADPGFFTPSPIGGGGDNAPNSSSSSSRPPNGNKSSREERVSDHEYNLRVGRACDLLLATLPDFMRTGLVDYQDNQPSKSSGLSLLDVFTFRAMLARDDARRVDEEAAGTPDQVYDSRIHFQFRPAPPELSSPSHQPSTQASPTDEEAASLSFSGRSLYFASAQVLRHTLNVLFSDPRVEVRKLRLERKGNVPRVEDVVHIRLEFAGHLRVTGQEHNYTLIFRYDFDADTGRISRHTVERVEPAIGRKLWAGIATVWQRLIGQHQHTPVPSACHIEVHRDGSRYHRHRLANCTAERAQNHESER